LIYCLFLGFRNKTVKEFVNSNNPDYLKNYFFSALAGIIWYLQFMFYGMGTTQMGEYDFSSWSIHMSFIIVFSNMWGLFFNEWTNSSKLTKNYILSGLVILIISTFIIGVGNYLHN
jgi:L-rhamnose-H+ transport protein